MSLFPLQIAVSAIIIHPFLNLTVKSLLLNYSFPTCSSLFFSAFWLNYFWHILPDHIFWEIFFNFKRWGKNSIIYEKKLFTFKSDLIFHMKFLVYSTVPVLSAAFFVMSMSSSVWRRPCKNGDLKILFGTKWCQCKVSELLCLVM